MNPQIATERTFVKASRVAGSWAALARSNERTVVVPSQILAELYENNSYEFTAEERTFRQGSLESDDQTRSLPYIQRHPRLSSILPFLHKPSPQRTPSPSE